MFPGGKLQRDLQIIACFIQTEAVNHRDAELHDRLAPKLSVQGNTGIGSNVVSLVGAAAELSL